MDTEILDDLDNKLASNDKRRSLSHVIHGTIQIVASLYVVYTYTHLWYLYKYSDILWLFMYPDWVLVIFISLGLIGSVVGLTVFRGKLSARRGYLWLLYLLFIGIATNIVFYT